MENGETFWKDRKRLWCGLPWTFTVYQLDEEKLYIKRGFFTVTRDEVRLYRIKDVSLKQTFFQRVFGIGSIVISSSDASLGNFQLQNIKTPETIWKLLSNRVEEERQQKRVGVREFYGDDVEIEEP